MDRIRKSVHCGDRRTTHHAYANDSGGTVKLDLRLGIGRTGDRGSKPISDETRRGSKTWTRCGVESSGFTSCNIGNWAMRRGLRHP